MSKNKEINEKIALLKIEYKNDSEALAEIKRAEETVAYYEKNGDDKKAVSSINQLEAFLHDWY